MLHRLILAAVALAIAIANSNVDANPSSGIAKLIANNYEIRQLLIKSLKKQIKTSLKDDATNSYIDAVTAIASQYIVDNNLDIYTIPSNSFLGVDSQGYIGGYTLLQRNGDAVESTTQNETQVNIDTNIDIVSITANFTWSTNFNNTPASGYAECAGNPITFSTTLTGPYDEAATSTILNVQDTLVTNVGAIQVVVYGAETGSTLETYIQNYFVDYIQVFVPVIVENNIKAALQNTLDNDPFPLI